MNEEKEKRRVFRTPIIVPISVIVVIIIHFGYIWLNESGIEQGFLESFIHISFEVLIFCEIGMMSMIFHNKAKVDSFLDSYPEINSKASIEELKPILRTNMYSALFTMIFLAIGALAAIVSIANDTFIISIVVSLLCIATAIAINWYNSSESKLKQIKCSSKECEEELMAIFECWLHKALPNF